MEVEAKYTVPDAKVFERGRALAQLGEYVLRPAETQTVTDVYCDTAEMALLRGGYACRLRERAGQWRATVKGVGGAAGAVHQREEFEVDVAPGAPPAQWPESLARAIVLSLCGEAPIAELFRLRQTRSLQQMHHGQRTVAEAAWDVVEIEAGAHTAQMFELEIELRGAGTLDDLRALELPLSALGLQPQPLSKFERAFALLGLEPPTTPKKPKPMGLRAYEPMAEAARKILAVHFEKMRAHEFGTRLGINPEALHDMRVATRRQRSALRLFAPHFRRKAVRPFRRALRELAGHLGAVRDWDVRLEAAQTYALTLGERAPAFQPLLEQWVAQRELERAALVTHLDSAAYREFLNVYRDFLNTAGAGVKAAEAAPPQPRVVAQALPAKVWEQFAAVRAYEAVLPYADVPLLHALRIEAKRLRYTLEFFREILRPSAEDAITRLVALQDHLGQLHDTTVALDTLRDFLARGAQTQLPSETMSVVGQYLQFLAARSKALRRGVSRCWRKAAGKQFKRWLTKALQAL